MASFPGRLKNTNASCARPFAQVHLTSRLIITGAALLVVIGALSGTGCTRSCASADDCGSGENCVYKIGSCTAQGECQDLPNPRCGFVSELCSCTGHVVSTGCGFADGYASGPTTGTDFSSCMPPPKQPSPGFGFSDQDADVDAASDAGMVDAQ